MTLRPALDALAATKAAAEAARPGRGRRVTLFGSVARGEATGDSAFDVLVLLEAPTFAERGRVIDAMALAALEHRVVLSAVGHSTAEWQELIDRERLLPRESERDGVDA